MCAAIVAIVIVYVALRLPGLDVPLDRDEGTFGYLGQLIHRGGLPYKDGVVNRPPVAFYINAIALQIVPATARGIHVFLLLYNFLTLVCLFYLAKIYFESLPAAFWTAFAYAVLSASPAILGFSASAELWALLPISASVLFAVAGIRKDRPVLIFASGVAGAIACWTKQTAAASVLFALLYVVLARFGVQGPRSASIARAARGAFLWLAGAVSLSAGIVLYFYAHHALRELLYWCFTYGFSYASRAASTQTTRLLLLERAVEVARSDFLLWTLALGAAILGSIRRKRWGYFTLGFLVLSILGPVPGFAYRHYFAQIAPAGALAAGQGFALLLGRLPKASLRLNAALACGSAVLAISVSQNDQYFLERDPNAISRYYFRLNPFPESKPVADYIAAHTQPDDPIVIVGSEAQILFYSHRRSSSAFLETYAVLQVHPRYGEFQDRMLAEVQRNPPKYIVTVVGIPFSLGWDGVATPDLLNSLSAIIERDYKQDRVRSVGGSQGRWIDPQKQDPAKVCPCLSIFKRNEAVPGKTQ